MHHFFVSPDRMDGEERKIVIDGSDVKHIRNVLRMKESEKMLISDGQGNDYVCEIEGFDIDGADTVTARILGEEFHGTELPTKIYLFQGLPKSDKMEWIVQKAVELGVYAVVPVVTKRTIVKLDDKKEANKLKRWNLIAESAAKQSRRSIIPKVTEVMSFQEALGLAKDLSLNLIPYENFKDLKSTKEIVAGIVDKEGNKPETIGIFIGPEGGFEESEVDLAMGMGVKPISLGRRILRTETAGLMILSVLMFEIDE